MKRQIFISYSNQDRAVADSIHDALEGAGLPVWMAHRDLTAGVSWSQRILDEIHASRVLILILSRHANESPYIIREVGEAVEGQLSILTVRIEDVPPSRGLKFFVGSEQWLDAFTMRDQYLNKVVEDVRLLLEPDQTTQLSPAPNVIPSHDVAAPPRPLHGGLLALARKHRTALRSAVVVLGLVVVFALGLSALPWGRTRVVIASTPTSLFVGDTFQLDVEGDPENISWSSSDTAVISVTGQEGVFRAAGTGTAVLSARAGRNVDAVEVTVQGARIRSLAISPPPDLRVGDSFGLSVAAVDAAGSTVTAARPTWSSETPNIVSVDENGVAVGLARGRSRITARVDTVSAFVDILVMESARPRRTDVGTTMPSSVSTTAPSGGGTRTTVPSAAETTARSPIDSPPRDPPAPAVSRSAAPTAAELQALAKQCIDALGKGDRAWIAGHYDPVSPGDHENLRKLEEVLTRSGFTFTVAESFAPQPRAGRMDFRGEFNYRSFFGGSVSARGTFRLEAEAGSGSWGVGSCRVVGDFVVG